VGKLDHFAKDRFARPVLVGLMGVGKSSIGRRLARFLQVPRRLARFLQVPLIDLDETIVAQAGCSIPEIFNRMGEAAFRQMETAVLKQVIDQRAVIATGGGVVMAEENRTLLRSQPPVIWLQASPEYLAARIDGDSNRPLIAGGDTLKRLQELAALRDPLYRDCADLIVPREFMKKHEVVLTILRFLAAWQERSDR